MILANSEQIEEECQILSKQQQREGNKRNMSSKLSNFNGDGSVAYIKRLLVLFTIALMITAGVSMVEHNLHGSVVAAATATSESQQQPQVTPAAGFSYADVVSHVSPAVVTVHSAMRERSAQQFPFLDDQMLNQLFGQRKGQRQPQQPNERMAHALGSGVIVSSDGYILTNHHVVDGAEQVKVDITDNRTVDAKVVGVDAPSDLAVLKVDVSGLPVLPLGNSDIVRVGDVVLAVGNPLGVGKTVTMGIISAKGRQTGLSNGSFEDFLQTDAPINQGNSGGALVNTSGQLVGINSQILSQSGGSIGIGFAIPSNMAKTVMDQLIKSGKVHRGQLGIVVQKVSSDIASSLNLKESRGVIVSQVQAGTAAERAGIKQGDVITSLNGVEVDDPNTFRNHIAGSQPGASVSLDVLRDGQKQQVRATLGEFSPAKEKGDDSDSGTGTDKTLGTGKLGIGVQPVTPEVAQQLGLPAGTQGLVVGQVDPTGPAAEAGIQEGDVITKLNQQNVKSAADLQSALQKSGTRPALALVNRNGQTIFMTIRPRTR
ncbi:MAG: serine protease Do [Blastocatellia bacterium]|jgi:Do/DeqQ family serine protease|nr:serine protease Do [Blastocatellia bacterium]